ncbi:MAG: hypothetical protein IJ520_05990 [Synergistaceae bacterium]|nr:hypothetical protein [Synergistaceae bacterium]
MPFVIIKVNVPVSKYIYILNLMILPHGRWAASLLSAKYKHEYYSYNFY